MSRKGKVTVVGAGFYGSTTAQRLAEYDIFDRGRAHRHHRGQAGGAGPGHEPVAAGRGVRDQGDRPDHRPGRRGLRGRSRGSTIVIVTAGLPRKPGMSRMDLIEANAKIVRSVVENVAKHAPDAVLIVVSNPLDEMTALAAKRVRLPAPAGDGPGGHAGHGPVQLLRGREAWRCRSARCAR